MNGNLTNFMELARDEHLNLIINGADVPYEMRGDLKLEDGNAALEHDIWEKLSTPMWTRIYDPHFGHQFDRFIGQIMTPQLLENIAAEWRRLLAYPKADPRIKAGSAVARPVGENTIEFSVLSAINSDALNFYLRR